MKSLKNISLFKVIILVLVSLYFNNYFLYFLIITYLIIDNYRNVFVYLLALMIIFSCNYLKDDYINIGIVESKNSNYYIIDKLIYKTKLITDDTLQIGDVLIFENKFNINEYQNELIKNIQFYGFDYKKQFNLKIRLAVYKRIISFNTEISNSLLKLFYNINTYDDIFFNLGYGFAAYYLFKSIFKKNKYVGICLLSLYSIIFIFNIKFYILIIDFLLSFIQISKIDKFSIKLFILYLINPFLFQNYSISIPLLLQLYAYIHTGIDFKTYFVIMESILFGEINILSSIFYRYYFKLQIFLLILGIIYIIFPQLNFIYYYLLKVYSFINDIQIKIRGSMSIISILILIILVKMLKIENKTVILIIILLLIYSPTNHPFGHVSFIDVGQGDAILVSFPFNSGNILFDTGSKYNYYKLKSYLISKGIYKIDYLVISHNDSDHNGNVEALKNDFIVENIVDEPMDIKINDVLFKNYYLGEFTDDNENSLVYGFRINNLSYLLTGDITSSVEKLFINQYSPINYDVLKVSHHGSNSASSKYFLSNILPKYAIISTSGQYGHPAKDTINNLDAYLIKYFVTKEDKNIEFYFIFGNNLLKYGNLNFAIIK